MCSTTGISTPAGPCLSRPVTARHPADRDSRFSRMAAQLREYGPEALENTGGLAGGMAAMSAGQLTPPGGAQGTRGAFRLRRVLEAARGRRGGSAAFARTCAAAREAENFWNVLHPAD